MQKAVIGQLYSLTEFYQILYQAMRSRKYLSRAKKSGAINLNFEEKVMLAVTEVNRCAICSYAHTKIALEAGMSNEEIHRLLHGDTEAVADDELPAILFAQHYADSRANPSKQAWQRILTVYGEDKAKGILGAIRKIMLGNALGIALGSLKGRIQGKADPRSNLLYEISMLLATILFFPVSLVHTFISGLRKAPLISFLP